MQRSNKSREPAVNEVGVDMMQLNALRKTLMQEHHDESLRIMQAEHNWKKERHELKMQNLLMQQQLLRNNMQNTLPVNGPNYYQHPHPGMYH
jgi:hypothetical protein